MLWLTAGVNHKVVMLQYLYIYLFGVSPALNIAMNHVIVQDKLSVIKF